VRIPKEERANFAREIEAQMEALYLAGQYDKVLEGAWSLYLLGVISNNEGRKADAWLFSARALARQGKDKEAFLYLARVSPVYERIGEKHRLFFLFETLVRVAGNLGAWEDAKSYLNRLGEISFLMGEMHREMFLFHRGVVAFHEGRLEQAKRDWQEALSAQEFYPETRGLTLTHLAQVLLRENRATEALEYAKKALSFAETQNLPWVEFVASLLLSQILSEQFFHEELALEHLEKAQKLADQMNLAYQKVWVLNNKAVIYTNQGEYEKARKVLEEALKIEEALKVPADLGVLINSGVLSFYLGDYEDAERYLKRACEEAQASSDRYSEALASANLGMLYRAYGKLREAFVSYTRAYQLFEELHAEAEMANLLNSIASLNVSLGEWKKAEEALTTSLELYRLRNDREGIAQVKMNWGYVYLEQEHWEKAKQYFEEAFRELEGLSAKPLRFYILLGLGSVELKMGSNAQALLHLQEALEIVESTRDRMERITDRICFTESRLVVYELLIEELFWAKKWEEAFNLSERVKAKAFLDLLVGQSIQVKEEDVELVQKVKAWEREKELLEKKKGELLSRPKELQDPVALWKISEDLNQVNTKLKTLYEELQTASPELLSLVTVAPRSLAEIQAKIPPEVVVFDYLVLPEHTLVWVVTSSSLQGFDLPIGGRELEEKIIQVRQCFQDPKTEYFTPLLDFLGERLFAPLQDQLQEKKKILVIPHRALSYLPFQTLRRGGKYLLEDYIFFYAPSLNVYLACTTKENQAPLPILAFGNPQFPDPSTPPLPGAEEEVKAIAKLFSQGTVLLHGEATESAFYEWAPQAQIIHLSTHGSAHERLPLLSLVLLAPDNHHDGYLLAAEIFSSSLHSRLVVLSACQTALGQYSITEGLIGLTRSFFYAGTESLIASLWSVSDMSTMELFISFYHYFLQGFSKAEALSMAQRDLVKRYPHPYYWAPFILLGKER